MFEIITETENGPLTVCGGGRYDGLVEELGGPATPGIGPWHLPKTGDSSQPLLWLVLMLAAGAGLILVLVKKHKENGGQKK